MSAKRTLRLEVDPQSVDSPSSIDAFSQGAAILRRGGTVAFPTETVYGLGANALDPAAVEGIFLAKQRPSWDPLIVHVIDLEQLDRVAVDVPDRARPLMDAFWPGPLTLLLPRNPRVPKAVTAGRERVGVRMPQHPVAARLIQLAGLPIAAPSANSFGRTSPTRAEFVLEDLDGRIDALIDSGETTLGLESTVVDICEDPPLLYRPGMVTLEQLRVLCPSLKVFSAASVPGTLPAPGVGLKHYSPRARLILVQPQNLSGEAESLHAAGESVGIMLFTDLEIATPGYFISFPWGHRGDLQQLARRLFAGLRQLDAAGVTVILCPLPPDEGLGMAICDRLRKAAR